MSLIDDVCAARKAHMTYGQYMTSQHRKNLIVEIQKPKAEKTCVYCGNQLHGRKSKYCSYECYQKDHRIYW